MAYALVPKVGDGSSPQTAIRPKYTDPGDLGVGLDLFGYTAIDYGLENAFLMRVELSAAQRTALQAMPDALVVPTNIDSNVSGLALTEIQTKLEAVNLPADWVHTGLTYRQVLKGFRRVITFMQRFRGLHGIRLFGGGVTLDTQINQLSQAQRQRLTDAADALGLDYSGVTNTMTLRAALKLMADQLPGVTGFEGD